MGNINSTCNDHGLVSVVVVVLRVIQDTQPRNMKYAISILVDMPGLRDMYSLLSNTYLWSRDNATPGTQLFSIMQYDCPMLSFSMKE
jgi:hypothetical protein